MAKTVELQRFYASKKWTSLRNRLIVERGGVCQRCGELIDDTSLAIGHHKIDLTDKNYRDPSISLNPDTIEILCCHATVSLPRASGVHPQYLDGAINWVQSSPRKRGSSLIKIKRWNVRCVFPAPAGFTLRAS